MATSAPTAQGPNSQGAKATGRRGQTRTPPNVSGAGAVLSDGGSFSSVHFAIPGGGSWLQALESCNKAESAPDAQPAKESRPEPPRNRKERRGATPRSLPPLPKAAPAQAPAPAQGPNHAAASDHVPSKSVGELLAYHEGVIQSVKESTPNLAIPHPTTAKSSKAPIFHPSNTNTRHRAPQSYTPQPGAQLYAYAGPVALATTPTALRGEAIPELYSGEFVDLAPPPALTIALQRTGLPRELTPQEIVFLQAHHFEFKQTQDMWQQIMNDSLQTGRMWNNAYAKCRIDALIYTAWFWTNFATEGLAHVCPAQFQEVAWYLKHIVQVTHAQLMPVLGYW